MARHVVVDIQFSSGNKNRIICRTHDSSGKLNTVESICGWYNTHAQTNFTLILINYKGGRVALHPNKIDSIDIYEAVIKTEPNPLNHNYGEDEIS